MKTAWGRFGIDVVRPDTATRGQLKTLARTGAALCTKFSHSASLKQLIGKSNIKIRWNASMSLALPVFTPVLALSAKRYCFIS